MFTDGLQLVAGSAESLADRLAGVSLVMLAAALALHVAKLVARARAWHNIVHEAYPAEPVRYRHMLGAYLSGIGLNAVLPARPGEVLKLALVKRKAPETRYQGLASTLLTESVFDTVTGAAALALGVVVGWTTLGSSLEPLLRPIARHSWPVAVAGFTAAVVIALARHPLTRKLRGLTAGAARGFAVFGHPRRYLGTVVSWQLTALVLRVASVYCFLAAFRLQASTQTILLVIAVQSVAGLIPLTPNGAGTQQALLVLALGTGATSSSIVRFGAGAQLVTVAGDIALALLSFSLMTGSLRWRGLLAGKADARSSGGTSGEPDQAVAKSLPSAA